MHPSSGVCELRDQGRKVAIALNNAGIVFLRRQEYGEALESFRSAMQAMKIAAGSSVESRHDEEQLCQFLMRASHRAACISNAMVEELPKRHAMDMISSQSAATDALSMLANVTNTSRMILPMVIDKTQEVDETNLRKYTGIHVMNNNIDLESCILVRNYGLAYGGLAQTDTDSSLRMSHLSKSYRLLTLAKVVLEKLYESDTDAGTCDNVLLLELLLKYDLLQTSVQLPLEKDRISEHEEDFQFIVFWIQAQDSLISVGSKAAAAA
jgi:hypothetical protein